MNQFIKKTGIQFGLTLGVIFALLTLYIHLVQPTLIVNVWAGLATIVLNVVFGILAIIKVKSFFGGRITFKDAFSSYFMTIFIGLLINTIVLLLLYSFILSPENLAQLKQIYIEFNVKMINQNFAQADNLQEIIDQYKAFDPFTISEVVIASVKYLLRDCIIGLLVSLIFRNQKSL